MKTHLSRVLVAACAALLAACPGPAGQDGKPCAVKDNGNGTTTISCPDGTTATVANGTPGTPGTNGSNGTNGTPGANGTNGMNGANGSNGANGTNGTNGVNGTSCSVSANPDAGTKTITCTDGTTVVVRDGTNGVDANAVIDFAGLSEFELTQEDFSVRIQSVSNVARPVARFQVFNRQNKPVKNIPPGHFGGIALLQLVPGNTGDGGNGVAIDTWINHISNCTTCSSSTETASTTSLVDNGDGSYVYTFVKDVITAIALDGGGTTYAGVQYDANAVHRFALRLGFSGNPYRPVDATFDYIPAVGTDITGQNDKVNTANCLTCHNQWRANAKNIGGATPFHSGQRYDTRYCVVCHNDQRKYSGSAATGNAVIAEPTIDSNGNMTPVSGSSISVLRGEAIINLPVFAHKIHAGEHLTLKGNYAGLGTEINEFMFPQDVRNCTKCHSNAAKADNWKNKPNRRACGACHDSVNFATGVGHGPSNLAQPNDANCTLCHDATFIETKHKAVAPLDPNNYYSGGTGTNTNSAALGNINNPPAGARVMFYDLNAVTTVDAGNGLVSPSVKFRFKENDAGVVFNTYDGGNELLDNFFGSPSVYCVWAMPQDGIQKPADFNSSSSVYLRNAWAGLATSGASASSFSGPDTSGYYTVTITGTKLAPVQSDGGIPNGGAATMLTCGLGYTYSLYSATTGARTPPLTQTNVVGYAFNTTTKVGGISMPMPNVWRVASGFTGRRGASASTSATGQIAQTSRCADCHNQLGISPTYHSGQRNDAATCSFCHNPNRTSSGWTAGSESFIHSIHAAQRRTVPFNWHAVAGTADHAAPSGFWGVEYPGRLNYCESCHQPGYYDFSASWYTSNGGANLANRLVQTVAQGTYDAVTPQADGGAPALAISVSPYVVSNVALLPDGGTDGIAGAVDYGVGYSFTTSSRVTVEAADTTLVLSPITKTCFGCHDSMAAKLHMETNGGSIYRTRADERTRTEQCMICHGPGKLANIKDVHYR